MDFEKHIIWLEPMRVLFKREDLDVKREAICGIEYDPDTSVLSIPKEMVVTEIIKVKHKCRAATPQKKKKPAAEFDEFADLFEEEDEVVKPIQFSIVEIKKKETNI